MVDEFIYNLPRFSIDFLLLADDFNRSVWACNLTGATSCTAMFIIFIVSKYHLPPEAFEHLKRTPVFRILLGDDLLGMGDIVARDGHAPEQSIEAMENAPYIFCNRFHHIRNATPS